MSIRETLLAAIATALSGVASGRVYRSRREQLATMPAVVIEPISEDVTEIMLGRLDRRMTVAIHVFAKGDTPDSSADSTLEAAWSAIAAAAALNTGDVQLEMSHAVEWDFEEIDHVRATLRVTLNYRTNVGAM
jgi:hypothetical protein